MYNQIKLFNCNSFSLAFSISLFSLNKEGWFFFFYHYWLESTHLSLSIILFFNKVIIPHISRFSFVFCDLVVVFVWSMGVVCDAPNPRGLVD